MNTIQLPFLFVIILSSKALEFSSYSARPDAIETDAFAYGTRSDGTVFLFGGRDIDAEKLVQKWNPKRPYNWTILTLHDTDWTSSGDITCYGQCQAQIQDSAGNEYLFIISRVETVEYDEVMLFNMSSERFVNNHNIPDIPGNVRDACVSTDGWNYIYVSGGNLYDNSSSDKIRILNISSSITSPSSWRTIQMPNGNGRQLQSCIYVNGFHYDFGGQGMVGTGTHELSDILRYDTINGNWSQLDYTFSNGMYGSRAVRVDDTVYVIGGTRDGIVNNQLFAIMERIYTFNMTTETFNESQHESLPIRSYSAVSIVKDTLYVIGEDDVVYARIPALFTPTTAPTTAPTESPTDDKDSSEYPRGITFVCFLLSGVLACWYF